jgi:hypothetical protein
VAATDEHKIMHAIESRLVTQFRWLGSASNTATVGSALARPNANFRKSRRRVAVFFYMCGEVPYLSPQNPKKDQQKNYAVFRRSLRMRFPKYKEDLKVALVTRALHLGSCGYDARNSDNGPAYRGSLARNLLCRCRDATRASTPTQTLTYNFCGALLAPAEQT